MLCKEIEKKGFSPVDLGVAVAVIAVLVSLLLPAFVQARHASQHDAGGIKLRREAPDRKWSRRMMARACLLRVC
jgi:Tfp pilus assembly protein PilE